jgi:hypothetical protein
MVDPTSQGHLDIGFAISRKRSHRYFLKWRRSAIESFVLPTFENRGIAG